LLAAGGPCFLQSTCNDCDKGIQANDNGCKYASFYHVFHKIKFNTLKKAKHQAEGNSIIHQLKNMGDKMMQGRVEFRPWVICVSLGTLLRKQMDIRASEALPSQGACTYQRWRY
jgi:hypothetical protein